MPRYLVTWEIDVLDVADPEAAARQAWQLMRGAGSTASVFDVIDQEGRTHHVDLQELDEEAAAIRGIGDVLRNVREASIKSPAER